MIAKLEHPEEAGTLFADMQNTFVSACRKGRMGDVYVCRRETETLPETDESGRNDRAKMREPCAAMAMLGDFCFFAGKPCEELVRRKPQTCEKEFMIMVPPDEAWAALIEKVYREKACRVVRYAMKKRESFDMEKLRQAAASLPQGYVLREIDKEIYEYTKRHDWCADWTAQYADYEEYRRYGLGIAALKDGVPVAGASSYAGDGDSIEIQIDTKEEFRRRTLAYCCAAKLILTCLRRGVYPGWDAQNNASLRLAQKLGYHCSHTYAAYEIFGY